VRDYILAWAAAPGLDAEVDQSGGVENVIVRLPGRNETGIVLVTGHYDSQPPAPGAGDDGISVAAMLETMRVLSAGAPLRNDVVFLFADGE
jgi:Zn-dependent M28 family amino/carboxypeptidase